MIEGGKIRIGSIVLDCHQFGPMQQFWQGVLGYVPREPGTNGWVVLRDPAGLGPNLSINLDPETVLSPEYRIHLDLYSDRPEVEVDRILKLGATLHRRREPGEDFVVLADPEGNLFCVIDTRTPAVPATSDSTGSGSA
ncbi:MAG: VOC family protein [Thermoplasmata archaeon]